MIEFFEWYTALSEGLVVGAMDGGECVNETIDVVDFLDSGVESLFVVVGFECKFCCCSGGGEWCFDFVGEVSNKSFYLTDLVVEFGGGCIECGDDGLYFVVVREMGK